MKEKEIRALSYTCNNDLSTKCPDSIWKPVRPKYRRTKNFNFNARTKNLLDMKSILDNMKVPFFLTHGALLGAYRENDFIKYDDDIDLDIFEEILLPCYDDLCNNIIKAGFIIRGRNIKIKKQKGEKFNAYRKGEKIAIRGIYLDPDYRSNKYRLTNIFQYLRKFHENPDTILFKGKVFMTPGSIEEFLIYCFGKEWRTPVFHTKEEKKKGFKRGVRRPGK